MNITKDDLVISYWAIGPSYRTQLKENLLKQPLDEDWFNIVILTDYPDDFAEFADNKNIIEILDIAEQRKEYDWSFVSEKIPPATMDEEIYSEEFNRLRRENMNFSYSLHRFSLPWIISKGFSKFVLLDADVYLSYEGHTSTEKYINYFIQVNFDSMPEDSKMRLLPGRIIERDTAETGEFYDTLSALVEEEFPDISIAQDFVSINIGDGPIKIYKFDNLEEASKYFDVWNFVTKNIMGEYKYLLINSNMIGPYAVNDELTIAFINKFLNIQPMYDVPRAFTVKHDIYKTRYFALTHGTYEQASSLEKFLEVNNLTLDDINL